MIAYEIFWGAWPCSEWDSRLDLKETKTLDLFPKASGRRAGLKSGQGGPFFRLMDSFSFNTSTGLTSSRLVFPGKTNSRAARNLVHWYVRLAVGTLFIPRLINSFTVPWGVQAAKI